MKYIPCIGHNRIYLIDPNDIYYANCSTGGVYVYNHTNLAYSTELTLKTLAEKTPLVYCHRQHLINIQKLKEIRFTHTNQTEIILNNDISVPASRRYLKLLKEQLGLT